MALSYYISLAGRDVERMEPNLMIDGLGLKAGEDVESVIVSCRIWGMAARIISNVILSWSSLS